MQAGWLPNGGEALLGGTFQEALAVWGEFAEGADVPSVSAVVILNHPMTHGSRAAGGSVCYRDSPRNLSGRGRLLLSIFTRDLG